MSDNGTHGQTPDGVLERVEALEAENTRLAGELAALKASAARQPPAGKRHDGDSEESRGGVSRRGVVGGAVAMGMALVAGAAIGADPAAAGTDGDLTLGSSSNIATSPTGLEVNGDTSAYGIGVTDNGLGAYPSGDFASLFGHAHSENSTIGVFGYADAGGTGVNGISKAASGGQPGDGVHGAGSPGVHGEGLLAGDTGVAGEASGAPGVSGFGSPGVGGLAGTVGDVGVRGTVSGKADPGTMQQFPATGNGMIAEAIDGSGGPPASSSNGLLAANAGSGAGVKALSVSGVPVLAQITNASSAAAAVAGSTNGPGQALRANQSGTGHGVYSQIGNTSNAGAAVYGNTNGSGQGVRGYQTGSGYGVHGQIANTSNSRAAVYATTNGSGPALQGNQSGTGSGVLGQISNSANTQPAVLGTGSSSGRGGQFSGGAAQVRLVPAGTLPTSGQTGDLFVDSGGHLHYCKAGGSTASWMQLA